MWRVSAGGVATVTPHEAAGDVLTDHSYRIDGRLITLLLILAVPQALLAWVGMREPLLLVGAALFAAVAVLAYSNTFAGLLLIVLLQMRTLQSNVEIDVVELAYAALFGLTLLGWLVRHARSPEGARAVASPVGRAISVFFIIAAASLLPALLYGGSVLWWFRDLVRFSPLVLFFPIATVARSRKSAAALGIAFLAVVVFFAVNALLTYNQMLSVAAFASEMQWQRAPVNEVLPMVALVGAATLFFLARRRSEFAAAIVLGLVSTLALAVSLSRGFWLGGVIAVAVSALACRARPARVAGFALILAGAALAGAYAVFGWRIFGVLGSLASRFSTLSSPLASITVYERLEEARAQIELIARNPIIGHGLGATFSYMSPIRSFFRETNYGHNAYLFLVFKLGIVGLVSYLVLYLRGVAQVFRSARSADSVWMRAALFAGFGVLIAFLALSVTSPQFYSKNAGLVIVLVLGVAQAVASTRQDSACENSVGEGSCVS